MHLIPDNGGAGHFNVLRGHLSSPAPGVSGIKVVGDFVANYARGLPSELGLLTLYDPATGIPLSIIPPSGSCCGIAGCPSSTWPWAGYTGPGRGRRCWHDDPLSLIMMITRRSLARRIWIRA